MKFRKNIGTKNRIARLVAGIVLVVLGLMYLSQSQIPSIIGIVLGVIFLLEAAFSYCIVHDVRGAKDMR